SGPGEGAGKTNHPQGLAVDFETGRLYVADQGNHRIDVFEANGQFAMAFGWGVVDGAAELQVCGPAASPPTSACSKGLVGGGAGELSQPTDVTVDNDPTSPSHHDIYVTDRSRIGPSGENALGVGMRIQKFTPDGQFLLTWGAGVISGEVMGTGALSAGSKQ